MPAYLQNRRPFDLLLLVDKTAAAAMPANARKPMEAQLAAVDLTEPATFPTASLEAMSTLDGAQVAAIKVKNFTLF